MSQWQLSRLCPRGFESYGSQSVRLGERWFVSEIMIQVHLVLTLFILFQIPVWAKAAQNFCTREQAIEAEGEASNLKDADSIYRSYKRFAHCDDGGIAEGYSDSVVRVLSDKKEFNKFIGLAEADKDFYQFALKHIDATTDDKNLELIVKNAKSKCPKRAQTICSEVSKKAQTALEEIKQVTEEQLKRPQ